MGVVSVCAGVVLVLVLVLVMVLMGGVGVLGRGAMDGRRGVEMLGVTGCWWRGADGCGGGAVLVVGWFEHLPTSFSVVIVGDLLHERFGRCARGLVVVQHDNER